MAADDPALADSPRDEGGGGSIPGADGAAAFSLDAPDPSAIPVLIAAPHAGRLYPAPLIAGMRDPGYAAPRLEDRYVDLLGRRVAQATGAALLVAHAPRAMIDLNRAPDDVDWTMIDGGTGGPASGPGTGVQAAGRRARTGLGLVPRRLPGLGELWKQRLGRADLEQRLADVHRPYHACLAAALARLRARWGAVLLVDLHSMPPLPATGSGPAPGLVLGDRFGAACDGTLVSAAFAWLARGGQAAGHNRPYAGGYVLDRHGDPAQGINALQLEVDRSRYLDQRLVEPGEGLDRTAALLVGLVTHLAARVADLGSEHRWADAAE